MIIKMFYIVCISAFMLCGNILHAKHYLEFTREELQGKKIALFGSFQCYDTFLKVMDHFEANGATILCPIRSKIVDIKEDFVKFIKDEHIAEEIKKGCIDLSNDAYTKCAEGYEKKLQQAVFDKTRKYADIVYIVNPEGCKVGLGTSSELGYTIALNDTRNKNIKIYCWEKPQSSHIRFFCEY